MVEFSDFSSSKNINTDLSLIVRILSNMIINGLEAIEEKGTVEIWLEDSDNALSFSVWKQQVIPPDIAQRIFHEISVQKKEQEEDEILAV